MACISSRNRILQHCTAMHAGPDLVPTAIFQNGLKCTLVNVAGAAFARPMAAPGTGIERAESPVRVQGPNIIGVDGNVLNMKGVNWFGFDVRSNQSTSTCDSDGCWLSACKPTIKFVCKRPRAACILQGLACIDMP